MTKPLAASNTAGAHPSHFRHTDNLREPVRSRKCRDDGGFPILRFFGIGGFDSTPHSQHVATRCGRDLRLRRTGDRLGRMRPRPLAWSRPRAPLPPRAPPPSVTSGDYARGERKSGRLRKRIACESLIWPEPAEDSSGQEGVDEDHRGERLLWSGSDRGRPIIPGQRAPDNWFSARPVRDPRASRRRGDGRGVPGAG